MYHGKDKFDFFSTPYYLGRISQSILNPEYIYINGLVFKWRESGKFIIAPSSYKKCTQTFIQTETVHIK